MFRKISALLLIGLIFNLNTVVPGVAYAVAEETCACHLNSNDHQCHCEKGCDSCGMHKEKTDDRRQMTDVTHNASRLTIKGMTCATSTQDDGSAMPALGIPFMVSIFETGIPAVQVSELPNLLENPLFGVATTPSEKPPTV